MKYIFLLCDSHLLNYFKREIINDKKTRYLTLLFRLM